MKKNKILKQFSALALSLALAFTLLPAAGLTAYGAGTTPASADETLQPAKVSGLTTFHRDDDEIELTWNTVSGADGYQVYRYNSSTGKWVRLITTSKTSCTITGLSGGTTYKFRVRPYRDALNSRYYGEVESITVKTVSAGIGSSSGLISKDKAKSIALADAGYKSSSVDFFKVHLDKEDGVQVYEIEFAVGDYEYEYEIHAVTGKILDYDRDYRWD